MTRLALLTIAVLSMTGGFSIALAQGPGDSEVEQWLVRLEGELTELQQRKLAARLELVRVSIEKLLTDYRTNEIAADEVYEGQRLEFSGIVQSVGDERGLHLILVSSDPDLSPLKVRCNFARRHRGRLAELSQSQSVRVRGDFREKDGSIVSLRNCYLD